MKNNFILVLPPHFKNFPKEIKQFVKNYKSMGYKVRVIFNQPCPTK